MATSLVSRAKMASRLKKVTDEEVTELKEAAENSNMRKSTINWVRVFDKWCDENSLKKNLEMILPEQLDKVLEWFYASVCKQDGTDYQPGSLKVMQAALDRHLKEKGCSFSIIKDTEFINSQKVLEGKASARILVSGHFRGRRCHFIHQFMTN